MEGLTSLPGVARKTANIVLGEAFGKVEGIAVDTHVFRLAHRFGFDHRARPGPKSRATSWTSSRASIGIA